MSSPLLGQATPARAPATIHPRAVSLPDRRVTPISGRSWLNQLGWFINETSMGKTGLWGPAPPQEDDLAALRASGTGAHERRIVTPSLGSISMTGADLYRLECQGCHRTDGRGVPPEINSMINPVRSTSPELVRKHMEEVGAPMDAKSVRELAKQSHAALVQRISHGGYHMPGFLDLNETEIQALVAYVEQLAGVPGAERRQLQFNEPTMRVGEHLVKATCHICHDSVGPKPSPAQMMDGEVPPLSTLVASKGLDEFVMKVTRGAPATMGVLQLQYRGRMPVFYYIRPEEATAAYLYLYTYPPESVTSPAEGSTAAAKAKITAGARDVHR